MPLQQYVAWISHSTIALTPATDDQVFWRIRRFQWLCNRIHCIRSYCAVQIQSSDFNLFTFTGKSAKLVSRIVFMPVEFRSHEKKMKYPTPADRFSRLLRACPLQWFHDAMLYRAGWQLTNQSTHTYQAYLEHTSRQTESNIRYPAF